MSSLRIALIACANGMGHVRRMLALSLALRDLGASPVLFAPRSAVKTLAQIYDVRRPEFVHFESANPEEDWFTLGKNSRIHKFPKLDNFDQVVSDNLIEILDLRSDAWLSGSFFWHKALSNYPPRLVDMAEDTLAKHNPRMIATEFFAPSYLAERTRLYKVGFYVLRKVDRRPRPSDILLTCGRGGTLEQDTRVLLEKISAATESCPFILWVEPALYTNEMPRWIQPASFTPAMYSRLTAVVTRPGVGTLTEALLAGSRLFLFHESTNYEMVFNAKRIQESNLGEVFVNPEHAWLAAVSYLKLAEPKSTIPNPIRPLNFEGAKQAAKLIVESA